MQQSPGGQQKSSFYGLLVDSPLFRAFTPHELAVAKDRLVVKSVDTGATLLRMGTHSGGIYILVKGTVKICVEGGQNIKSEIGIEEPSNQNDVVVALCGPGAVLGEIDALDGKGHSASVIAVEPSQLLWMSVENFHLCQEEIPAFNRNLLYMLAERERRSTHRTTALASLSLAGRLARQLLLFSRDYSYINSQGEVVLTIRPSQTDMADLVGSSRACVNRTLSHFKKIGCIKVEHDGRLILLDKNHLLNLC